MKITTLYHLLCFIMLFNCSVLAAQTSENTENQIVAQASGTKIEGTYQIQVVNSRNQPFIPANIEEQVLKNRQQNETKYIWLGTEVRLMVLPLSSINAPDFKAIERIAFIKE